MVFREVFLRSDESSVILRQLMLFSKTVFLASSIKATVEENFSQ